MQIIDSNVLDKIESITVQKAEEIQLEHLEFSSPTQSGNLFLAEMLDFQVNNFMDNAPWKGVIRCLSSEINFSNQDCQFTA